jgi:hypothetical protein
MREILITAGNISVRAELDDTPTAREILKILPLKGSVHRWGEEIYFSIPLEMGLEPDARQEVETGALGYWPEGPAFCIFFGRTPVSTGANLKAYSPVNVIGKVVQDPAQLKDVPEGAPIAITLSGRA